VGCFVLFCFVDFEFWICFCLAFGWVGLMEGGKEKGHTFWVVGWDGVHQNQGLWDAQKGFR